MSDSLYVGRKVIIGDTTDPVARKFKGYEAVIFIMQTSQCEACVYVPVRKGKIQSIWIQEKFLIPGWEK